MKPDRTLGFSVELVFPLIEMFIIEFSFFKIPARLLLETKHRGAFEQVHCGFSQLCAALWRSADEKLRSLPADWLRQVMQDLRSSESAAKLCRTRRSAGLPFMIQAILAPPAEFSTRPEVLDEALKDLLDIASGSEPEGRLHGLNILRMLFRDARLGQLIGPHVARALILAIDGFEAPLWPVSLPDGRNFTIFKNDFHFLQVFLV